MVLLLCPSVCVDDPRAHLFINSRDTLWWSTKPWRRRRPRSTARRAPRCWSRPFSATTPSSDLLHRAPERVEPAAEAPSLHKKRLEISLLAQALVGPPVPAMISRTLPLVSINSAYELRRASTKSPRLHSEKGGASYFVIVFVPNEQRGSS